MFACILGNDYLCRNNQQTMKKPLLLILTSIICFAGCKKEDPEQVADGFEMAVTPSNVMDNEGKVMERHTVLKLLK